MNPEDCSNMSSRIAVLEVHKDSHHALLTDIKATQDTIWTAIDGNRKEDSGFMWKVASSLIGFLVVVCVSLIGLIYKGIIS